jgi:uncharacterized caspase-like protein
MRITILIFIFLVSCSTKRSENMTEKGDNSNIIIAKTQTLNSKVRAVVIGISEYECGNNLNYADDDAYEFYNFLIRKYPESKSSIVLLRDQQATKQNILSKMRSVFANSNSSDELILFFSGHGFNGYFVPYNCNNEENLLYHGEVRKAFSLSNAKRKIVFADACRAGSIKRKNNDANTPFGTESYYQTLKKEKGGIALMLSSRWNQNSLETSRIENGIFTYHLLKGLEGAADFDGNKTIVIDEVYKYVRGKVISASAGKQVPIIFGQFSGEMPVTTVN